MVAAQIALEAWPDEPARGIERFQSGVISEKLKNSFLRGMGGAFLKSYLEAGTKRERAIVIRKWLKDEGVE